jgi:hypothetical protein
MSPVSSVAQTRSPPGDHVGWTYCASAPASLPAAESKATLVRRWGVGGRGRGGPGRRAQKEDARGGLARTQRVRSVRGAGCGVSDQYGLWDAACPISTEDSARGAPSTNCALPSGLHVSMRPLASTTSRRSVTAPPARGARARAITAPATAARCTAACASRRRYAPDGSQAPRAPPRHALSPRAHAVQERDDALRK